MLKIDISRVTRMGANGNQILRSLQNNHTNEVDLYVRETIQNSLDAGKKGKEVFVDFTLNEFSENDLLSRLEGTQSLKGLFESNKFLMITDVNTKGLDGPLSHESPRWDNGSENLLKLVYDIGKPQTGEGAGGSWGYGKSIHYRIGVGLVIYYTRIINDQGNYEERLAGCLVEDQSSKNTLIKYNDTNRTGIVWWGDYKERETTTIPVLDSKRIESFLKIFNTSRFSGEQTGTKVIVPFIDEDKLMNSIINGPSIGKKNYYDDLSDYIFYSVQRWYAPRLNNSKYQYGNKNNLIVSINDRKIEVDDQAHYFNIVRELYNYAQNEHDVGYKKYIKNSEVNRKEIKITNHESQYLSTSLVGNFVYTLVNYKELGMASLYDFDNPNFLSNLVNDEETSVSNKPIIMFTRQPGMIVNYVNDGEWLSGTGEKPIEEYIIGIFVLNSDQSAYFKTSKGNNTIEEYVRNAERSDHIDWFDSSFTSPDLLSVEPRIVNRIKRNVRNTLNTKYFRSPGPTGQPDDVISRHLSNLLGRFIMPDGFGTGASVVPKPGPGPRTSGGGTSSPRTRGNSKISIFYENTKFNTKSIDIPFRIVINKDCNVKFSITLYVMGITSKMPITSIETDLNEKSYIDIDNIKVHPDYDVTYKETPGFNTKFSADLSSKFEILQKDEIIDGVITISTKDRNLMPVLEIKEELGNV